MKLTFWQRWVWFPILDWLAETIGEERLVQFIIRTLARFD